MGTLGSVINAGRNPVLGFRRDTLYGWTRSGLMSRLQRRERVKEVSMVKLELVRALIWLTLKLQMPLLRLNTKLNFYYWKRKY